MRYRAEHVLPNGCRERVIVFSVQNVEYFGVVNQMVETASVDDTAFRILTGGFRDRGRTKICRMSCQDSSTAISA